MIVIEQKTGTVWDAQPCEAHYGRQLPKGREWWVVFRSGPKSEAFPGVIGFYASQDEIETKLGNV